MTSARSVAAASMLAVLGGACAVATPRAAYDRASCAAEVVLLDEAVQVFAAPGADSVVAATLPRGSAVYVCDKRTRWSPVLYPRPGERSDCTRREGTPQQCQQGWLATMPKHTTPD